MLNRSIYLILAPVLVLAIGLRLWAVGGDLWIDEIWSLNQISVARASENPIDWLALFFHSNTHPLNTLYLALIGPDASNVSYRALSLLSGIAMVFMALWVGLKHSVAAGVVVTILFSLSYPLINYSGEARGYAPMMLCAIAAYGMLESYLERPNRKFLLGFVVASVLGLMAHLTFGVFLAGFGLWALVHLFLKHRSVIKTIARLVPIFGAQILLITVYGTIAFKNMVRGGDCCPEPALPSLKIMTYWTMGLDAYEVTSILPLIVFALAALILIVIKAKEHDLSWIFYAIVIFAFPVLVLVTETSPQVIHRYFLPTILFLLILLSQGAGDAWAAGGWKRRGMVIFVAGFCLGQAGLLLSYSEGGRGQYGRALELIKNDSTSQQRITGFPTFSVGSVFEYQTKSMGYGDALKFVPTKLEGRVAADWFIHGYLDGKPAQVTIKRTLQTKQTHTYKLIETFPQWGLSGDAWAVYRIQR